jgi:hypothetical protein
MRERLSLSSPFRLGPGRDGPVLNSVTPGAKSIIIGSVRHRVFKETRGDAAIS